MMTSLKPSDSSLSLSSVGVRAAVFLSDKNIFLSVEVTLSLSLFGDHDPFEWLSSIQPGPSLDRCPDSRETYDPLPLLSQNGSAAVSRINIAHEKHN